MNVLAPVSTIMSTNLITVNPEDKLQTIKELFEKNKFHHLPVVRYKELVGIISKSDLLYFLKGLDNSTPRNIADEASLEDHTVESIMTTGLAKLEPDDKINVALEVFRVNLFHAIPVVKGNELVGIVTTYDIIKTLAEESVSK